MAFAKVTYIDNETVITAKNLNEIQDEVLRIGDKLDSGELLEEAQSMIDSALADIPPSITEEEVQGMIDAALSKLPTAEELPSAEEVSF